ncbi:DUF1499 domain-containing protein [Rhizobium sp. CG5]|uniref:DUF1499 domain-containing protein n=1 Tax=Rhizobium sp. CG5 TaxID=2726076 RepID=UPI002033D93A|nr:DUF1499 domain-containing protein [Rhizobium sp. CG5]MCM2476597.1 DUF1499 domain-containing protein [Rhizobium sp. CG5]
MTIRYVRPVSHAASIAERLGFVALVMLVVVFLLHRFGQLATPDAVALVLFAAVLAALAVPLALIGLVRLWQVGALGGVAAVKALLFAALPLAVVALGAERYMTRPLLYDVSTDLIDAPAWIDAPSAPQRLLPRPAVVTPADREAQLIAYPGLTGRRYEGALDRVYEAVLKVAKTSGFVIRTSRGKEYALPEFLPQRQEEAEPGLAGGLPQVVPVPLPRPLPEPSQSAGETEPPGTVRIQAETRTLLLGLSFDIMIRLREEAETTLVDIRVASRYGPHDLGLSAAIAEAYLHALDAELLGISAD